MGPLATKPTILIAEDHPMISIMLNDMIRELTPEANVIVVDSIEQAKSLVEVPQLVIADLDLLDSKGFDTALALSALFSNGRLLICSGILDSVMVERLHAMGCHHVNKACSYSDLFLALQSFFVSAGLLAKPVRVVEKANNEYHSNIYAPGSDKPLTWKQVEIMRKTADGLSAKEVARDMDISPDTVRGHIKEIFLRLGARNKGQAVEIFIRAERQARLLEPRVNSGESA